MRWPKNRICTQSLTTIAVQINQIHIKWPEERQKIKEIDVNKSLVTPPIQPPIRIDANAGAGKRALY